jgi:hypothetical protein|tara:strand:- start:310 stop:567 length:258 start_codon:yes stop_codon:yes gene_type:complete
MTYSNLSKSKAGYAVREKDESLVVNGKITSEMLIKERDFLVSNKGARTKSVRNRITRIESVLVARERILKEMLTKKKKEEDVQEK